MIKSYKFQLYGIFLFLFSACTINHTPSTEIKNVNYFSEEIQFVIYKNQELLIAKNHFPELEQCISEIPEVKARLFGDIAPSKYRQIDYTKQYEYPDSIKIRRKVIRRGIDLWKIPDDLLPNAHRFEFVICINREGLPIVSRFISSTSDLRRANEAFQKMSLNYLYEADYEADCLTCGKLSFYLDNANTINRSR